MIPPKKAVLNLIRVQEKEPPRLYQHRLDRNERTFPFSRAFENALRRRLDGELLMTYPEPEPLYRRFARWLGVPRDRLLFHSGSDLAIRSVFETYVRPGDRVLLHLPSYAMYKIYARMFEARVDTLAYDAGLSFDLGKFTRTLSRRHRVVILENPNGFVGNRHPFPGIKTLIQRARTLGVLVLVDEAYFHFIDETAADLIPVFDNLVVVRTFSKAFGFAGLRAAYLLSQEKNIQYLSRVKPMHELNSMAIAAIETLLAREGEFDRFIEKTKKSLAYLKTALWNLGIPTSDSRANFLAARLGKLVDGTEASTYLRDKGFLIRRPFREAHLKEWLRIGTAPIPVEKALIRHLRRFIELRRKTLK